LRLLLVEDDVRLARVMKRVLEEETHVVDEVHDGLEGLDLARHSEFDAILLDIMLPSMDGFEICRRLRAEGVQTPILVLTARDAVRDRVKGLDTGADDYLAKPFAFPELLARLRALARRPPTTGTTVLQFADVTLDPARHLVMRANREIDLSPREFALLDYMLRHPEQVLTRTQILDGVWGYAFESTANIVDTYVHYLRSKIDKGFGRTLIHTVRGIGYKLSESR